MIDYKPAVLAALTEALSCRGGMHSRGWQQDDVQQTSHSRRPQAIGPGSRHLWREHFAEVLK